MELELWTILEKMAELFLMLGIGYAANKLGVLDPVANRKLTAMVINLSMPGLIFYSVVGDSSQHSMGEVFFVISVSIICYLPSLLAGLFLPRLMKVPEGDVGLYRFMLLFGNVGFMGFPVVSAVFGPDAVFYASLINIPFNLLVYSVGILLISKKSEGSRLNLKQLVNVPFIASLASLAIYLLRLPVPGFVLGAAQTLGAVTTPVSMLIIGSTLAAIEPVSVFTEWRLYPMAALRLLALPAVLWFVLLPFFPDTRLLGIMVLIFGMPVAANATMLTVQYDGNQALASKGIFLTTLLSAATIPLLSYLMVAK